MKTEETPKSKRAKTDSDIPESLTGEPSGYTEYDLEIPVSPAEIVWKGGHAGSNYGSVLPQNLLPHNDVNSIGITSHIANSVASNSTKGHKDMPTSHGSGEPEASMEEWLNDLCDLDENMRGPETTDNITNECSQKTSLEIPASSESHKLPDVGELLRIFSTDDDISGITIVDNGSESSQNKSLDIPTSFEFDELLDVEELLKILPSDDDMYGKTMDDNSQRFVSRYMDAEAADGWVNDLGPATYAFAPENSPRLNESELSCNFSSYQETPTATSEEYVHSESNCPSQENSLCLNDGEPSYNFPFNSETQTANLVVDDSERLIFSPDNRAFSVFSHPDENTCCQTVCGTFDDPSQRTSSEMPIFLDHTFGNDTNVEGVNGLDFFGSISSVQRF